jgi:4-amino-4-deoxy-L-arabinose transferase
MKKVTLIIFVLFVLSYIVPLGMRPMVMPDETRYAEISREILTTGDWIVPKLDGLRYFEKPVLGHWFNAASQYLFGQNAFAVRLPSALAVGFSAFAIFLFVRRFAGGAQAGLLATATFLTCLEVFAIGVFCVLDSVFSMFITATLVTFYFAWTEEASRKKYAFLALSGMFCGLAFLTKGFLAFIFPALVILPLAIWERRWKELPAFCWMPLTTAFLVALPWSVAIYFREPDFWHYFFFTEHIERFIAADGGQHPEPFWFYVPILAGGALPWTPVFPLVIAGWRKSGLGTRNSDFETSNERRATSHELRFLLCWLIFPFLFFSACQGKLGTYILPCYPPLAILTAVGLLSIFDYGLPIADCNEAGPALRTDGMPSPHHQSLAALSRNLRNSAVILFVIVAVLILIQIMGPILPKITKWGPIVIPGVRIYDRSEVWKCAIVVIALSTYGLLLLHASDAENLEKKLVLWYLGPVLLMFGSHFATPGRFLYSKTPDEFLLRNQHRIHPDTVLVSDNYLTPAVCFCYKRADVFIVDRGGEFTYGLGYDDSKQRQLDIEEIEDCRLPIVDFNRKSQNANRKSIVLITSTKRYTEYRKKLPKPIFEDIDRSFVFAEFVAKAIPPQDGQAHNETTSKARNRDMRDLSDYNAVRRPVEGDLRTAPASQYRAHK